jgi:hypothetical protein
VIVYKLIENYFYTIYLILYEKTPAFVCFEHFNIFEHLGANDNERKGIFKRTNGKPIEYSMWNGNKPKNVHGRENCVVKNDAEGWWSNLYCNRYNPYICEKEKGKCLCSSKIYPH